MSWIFTIVFSGLLFSSSQGTVTECPVPAVPDVQNTAVTRMDETERFEQTYPLNANGRVSVSNVNGSIVAEAWDRNEVKLIAVKTADSKERLAEVEIKVESKPDRFSVETNYDNWKNSNGDRWKNGGKLQVDYQLMIPRGAVLNEVETVNGSVTISNFTNFTKVSAVNGVVKASNLRGTADLSTVNGEVFADFGSLDAGTKISLGTVNGKANLTIPSDSNATVKVDSLNGNITNDFGLPVRKGKYVGRDLYGRLGSGEVKIKLESVNGDLKILRQNDGKNLSPATNLLPQKDKDDEDWDAGDPDQARAEANIARVSREIARKQAATAGAVSAQVMADTQREVARIQPEIAKITADSVAKAAEVMKSETVQNAIRDSIKAQAGVLARISDAAFFPSMPRVERKSNSFAVKGVPTVNIEAHGCNVKITGWNKPEVQYAVTQLSSTRNGLPLDVNESHDDTNVTLKIVADDNSEQTRIEVFVPKKSNLKIRTDGEIRLEGVSGELDLTGENGAINVRDADGKLTVANTDGRVRVIGFRGEVQTKTTDGMINLEGDFTKLTAKADSGTIVVTMPENSAANIDTTSSGTRIDGLNLILLSENENHREYRLGNGGGSFKISTDGEVLLRSTGSLTTTF